MSRLTKLRKLCVEDHVHAICRGDDAQQSAYYTPELVQAIGELITGGQCQTQLYPIVDTDAPIEVEPPVIAPAPPKSKKILFEIFFRSPR